jgi:hypothetical protein
MEIWAECAKNRILSISRLLLSDIEKKNMEFVKTSDLLAEIRTLELLITKQRSRYSLDSADSRYVPAVRF